MVGRLSRKKSELLSKEKDVKYLYVVDYATTIRDYSVTFQVLGTRIYSRCGHVVRDFESEAKTRCNFQF